MTQLDEALNACELALPELRYQRRLQLETVLPHGTNVHLISAEDAARLLEGGAASYVAQLEAAIAACEAALKEKEAAA